MGKLVHNYQGSTCKCGKNKRNAGYLANSQNLTSFVAEKDQNLILPQLTSAEKVRHKILEVLQHSPEAGKSLGSLAKSLSISNRFAKDMLAAILEELMEEGLVVLEKDGQYVLPQSQRFLVGKVDFVNPNFAFIQLEGQDQDVFIRKEDLFYALHGDTVKIELKKKRRSKGGGDNNKPEGEVIEILERANSTLVGRLEMAPNYAFVVPDNRRFHDDIFIPKGEINGASHNDKVIVKIKEWPDYDKKAVGKIISVLGKAGDNDAEMHSIMAEFGLPVEFPSEVMAEAKEIPEHISKEDQKGRLDLRDILTFTIDPVDAKDFDDAISFQALENGNYSIGVHIADVTHYVRPGTEIDGEAYTRATSVYLVDRTIPMLPEKLSNNLCSLKPKVDRLAFSALFEITPDGVVVDEWFGRTIIHSNRRFTYEEAQERLDGLEDEFTTTLLTVNNLAKQFRQERFANGAISFETVEVKFKLDDQGKPLGVIPKVRKDAHKLVEEFMLLANKRVAEFVYNLQKGKNRNTMIYRIHEPPDPDKVETFAKFAKRFGYTIQNSDQARLSKTLNSMLEDIEGKENQNFLTQLAVRTMSKARYSTETSGHFGLAFPFYSHFTSPIRRYPDVIAHRLLQHYLDGGSSVDEEDIEEQAKHCSDRERLATDAERASIKYKQVEYMMSQPEDKIWDGVVSGVSEYGIYIEIVESLVEGMVRLSDLSDDYYEYDAENYRVVGQRSKIMISFGDAVKVKVKNTSLERRTIDFDLVTGRKDSESRPKGTNSRRSSSRNRGSEGRNKR